METMSKDGTAIAYDVQGTGPALVYVTGATCSRKFSPVVKDATVFAREFTVVTYDRRGRGDSGDTDPWSLDRELDDLEAVIDAVGGEALVYGHSSGAVLALHAADRLGPKVPAALLYDASWVHDDAERTEYADLRQSVEDLLDRGRPAAALRRFLVGIRMPKVFVALLPLTPDWRRMVALAPTLRYDMALTADLPPLDVAARTRTPVHVAVGERSPASVQVVASALVDALPGDGEVSTLDKQDHLVAARSILPLLISRLLSSSRPPTASRTPRRD